jgi:hypothetical protein
MSELLSKDQKLYIEIVVLNVINCMVNNLIIKVDTNRGVTVVLVDEEF